MDNIGSYDLITSIRWRHKYLFSQSVTSCIYSRHYIGRVLFLVTKLQFVKPHGETSGNVTLVEPLVKNSYLPLRIYDARIQRLQGSALQPVHQRS